MSFKSHTYGRSGMRVTMSEYIRRQPFCILDYFPSLSSLPFGYLSFLSAPMFGRAGRRLRTMAHGPRMTSMNVMYEFR